MTNYVVVGITFVVGFLVGGYILRRKSNNNNQNQKIKIQEYSDIYKKDEDLKDKNKKKNKEKNKEGNKDKEDKEDKEDNKEIKNYLFFDFDQMNDESKMSNIIDKKTKCNFNDLEYFVSYVITNYKSENTTVLIRISSHGGYAYLFERARDYLLRLKHHDFMTIAFIDDICASGGYMLACACTKIICTETSKIGSVGVLTSYVNFYNLLEKIGKR
jgi:ClpP class serine protease